VSVCPGPSAVETAFVASGLGADRYQFVGYLPRRRAEREALAEEIAGWPHGVVAFEAPRRLPESLVALARAMPERPGAVCRELTKRFEEVRRGTLAELAAHFVEPPRGEVTLVLGPTAPVAELPGEVAGIAAVSELVAAGASRRVAADVVARLTGSSRNALYRRTL
jgi:16S rRNA (cytidine1402-2'-O)-methyltransferase